MSNNVSVTIDVANQSITSSDTNIITVPTRNFEIVTFDSKPCIRALNDNYATFTISPTIKSFSCDVFLQAVSNFTLLIEFDTVLNTKYSLVYYPHGTWFNPDSVVFDSNDVLVGVWVTVTYSSTNKTITFDNGTNQLVRTIDSSIADLNISNFGSRYNIYLTNLGAETSTRYVNKPGLAEIWANIKNYITAQLLGKSNTGHTHTKSEITDFPVYGNTAGTICEGNDSRLSDARTPTAHTHSASDITSGLATVATSGSYNDLSNKPTIPTVNNATLTIQKNGTTVKTFTANASSNVTANITVPTKTSDLTNDSHVSITTETDTTSTGTPAHGGTFTCIDSVTRDSNGHVTKVNTKTVTLPSDSNTDTLVTQNVSTANENHPILLSVTKDATTNQGAKTSIFASGVKVNPSTGTVTATTFSGALSGNASSATQFSANKSVTLTGDVTGTASSKAGWSVATTLANSGVTAGTYGPGADVTGNNNATISVPEITVDAKGRVTSVTNRTLTCKNNTYNVYNKTLTIQQNGTTVDSFTANSSSDKTVNIQCVDLTSNQTVAGDKEFTGTTTAHDLVPSATNTYNFGSPSVQWNNAYIKSLAINGVACGDILTHNASEFVGISGNQTIGGIKTFSDIIFGLGSQIILRKNNLERTVLPASTVYMSYSFSDKSGFGVASRFSAVENVIKTNGDINLILRAYDFSIKSNAQSAVTLERKYDGTSNFYPEQNNTIGLGTSTNKWKTINGVEPSDLSLPSDTYITIDTTNFAWNTNFTFTPSVNGHLFISIAESTGIRKLSVKTGRGEYYFSNQTGILGFTMPVYKDKLVTILAVSSITETVVPIMTLFPCQGNV